MNIYVQEVRAIRKSTVLWSFSFVFLIGLFLSLFPSFSLDAVEFQRLLAQYPEGIRKAFGISLESITSLLGFYSYVFGYIVLLGSIQAMNLGISILTRENRERTSDFLLSKPVSRMEIVTAKVLAASTSLVFTNIIYILTASMIMAMLSEGTLDWPVFLLISCSAFFVECMFFSIGLLVSVLYPRVKSVLPLSLSITFSFYFLHMFGSVKGEDVIRYFTPFNYFDTNYIRRYSSYDPAFMIIEFVVIIILIYLCYVTYGKKDIHTV